MQVLTYESTYDTVKSFPLVTVILNRHDPLVLFKSTHQVVRYVECLTTGTSLNDVVTTPVRVVKEGAYTLRKVIHPKRAYVSNSWNFYLHLYPTYVNHPEYGHFLGYGIWNAPEFANP